MENDKAEVFCTDIAIVQLVTYDTDVKFSVFVLEERELPRQAFYSVLIKIQS